MFKRNMFSRILAVVLTLCLIFSFSPFVGAQSVGQTKGKTGKEFTKAKEQKFVTNQLIIKLNDKGFKSLKSKSPNPQDTGITALNDLNKKFKAAKVEKLFRTGPNDKTLDKWYLVTFKGKKAVATGDASSTYATIDGINNLTMASIVNEYKEQDYIEKAELNSVAEVNTVPNDLYYSTRQIFTDHDDLWGLKKIGAEQAWNVTTGNNVVVAVVDTGVDYNHPDLKANILRDSTGKVMGYDFANNDSDPMDDHFHGTHVAGTIAAVGNNDTNHSVDSGTRLVGVGWNLKIMPIKALDANGSGSGDALVNGLKFAADNGAKVVNNSWGSSASTTYFEDIIKYVHDKGVVPVFAAGNDSKDVYLSDPAGNPYAITVGSSNYLDSRSAFSNFGARLDFLAPGGDYHSVGLKDYILSARLANTANVSATLGDNYALGTGTSMAAPHASGAAAMILAAHPDYSVEEVRFALRNGADKVFGVNWDDKNGFGRINLAKAISLPSAPPVAYVTMKEFEMGKIHNGNSNIDITGIISAREGIKNWTAYLGKGNNPTSWAVKATGTSPVNGIITTLSTAGLVSDTYMVKLEVVDNKGQISQDYVKFTVDAELLPGWPMGQSLDFWNQPALGDIDGDGRNEIISTAGPYLYAARVDGSLLPGFPVKLTVPNMVAGYGNDPVLTDIDGDGKLEIIETESFAYVSTSPVYSRLWIVKYNGSIMSGWPKEVPSEDNVSQPATIADINGDNKLEILINAPSTGKIYAYNADGTYVSGWPASTAPTTFSTSNKYSTVTTADVNSDGKLEVFVGCYDGNIYAFNYNGTPLTGWPKKPSSLPIFAPVGIADINGDGKKEIVSRSSYHGYLTTTGQNISAYTADGNLLWTKNFVGGGDSLGQGGWSTPAFVDLDNSNGLEVVIATIGSKQLQAFSGNGSNVSGWPVNDLKVGPGVSIADINSDGQPEIAVGAGGTYMGVDILNSGGKFIWQRNMYKNTWAAPVLGDLDGDGKLEMVSVLAYDTYGSMFVWRLPDSNVAKNQIVWGQFMKDAQHTATYISSAPPGPAAPIASNVTISGKAAVNQVLTGSYSYSDANGDVEGVSTYRWLTSDTAAGTYTAIAGAIGKTYTLTNNDLNKYIKFEVSPVSATGTPNTGTLAQSTAVGPVTLVANSAPVAGNVTVSGITTVGQTLTGNYTYSDEEGDLQGVSTYKWLSSDTAAGTYTAITGAANKTYTLTSNDLNKFIKFEVIPVAQTGTALGLPVQSTAVGPVTSSSSGTAPTITNINVNGRPVVGRTLTGKYTYYDANGDIEGASILKWYRADSLEGTFTEIAKGKTYTLTIDDMGKYFKFEVTPVSQTGTPNTGNPVLSKIIGPVKTR